MEIYKIVEDFAKTHFVERYALSLSNAENRPYIWDLVQDTYLAMLTDNRAKVMDLYNAGGLKKVQQYVSGMLYLAVNSKTSRFYYRYIKHLNSHTDFEQCPEVLSYTYDVRKIQV